MHRRTLLSALPAAALMMGPRLGAAASAQPATIGIMGGEIDGTFMRIATDLTSVLNSESLRIIPIVGKGSLQNLGDLLHLPGVDLALVASDVLAYAQAAQLYPGKLSKVQYICKLYDNDVHVCARPEIKELADLQGKPVNIDVEGSGTNLTARDRPGFACRGTDHRAGQTAAWPDRRQRLSRWQADPVVHDPARRYRPALCCRLLKSGA
jgi:TRAP-type uncharacterized transport system substrate-binding protein